MPICHRSFATPPNSVRTVALIKIDAICVAHCSIDSDGNIDTSTSSRDCVYLQQPRIELDFVVVVVVSRLFVLLYWHF